MAHPRPPRVVIFDLDGVLVNTIEVARSAFQLAYREVVGDGEAPFEDFRKHLGRYFCEILDELSLPHAMEEPFVRESYRLAGLARVYEGVFDVLETFRGEGLALGVATGKGGERARALLQGLSMLDYFDSVVGGDEVTRSKPAPDMVRSVLGRLEAPPAEALLVGDSVLDLRAGRNAGVAVGAALWGDGAPEALRAEGPDYVFPRPRALLELVERRVA